MRLVGSTLFLDRDVIQIVALYFLGIFGNCRWRRDHFREKETKNPQPHTHKKVPADLEYHLLKIVDVSKLTAEKEKIKKNLHRVQ